MALLENIADMRTPYKDKSEVFQEKDLVAKEPFAQFRNWFETACHTPGIAEPNAMAVATATSDGKPSVRMILMKGFDESGFKFYSNYESRKGKELEMNGQVCLLFYWTSFNEGRKSQPRQVRIEGRVEKLPQEECESYFHSRPKESQIGACVSQQSSVIPSRHVLDEQYEELMKKYGDTDLKVPKPKCWGGYIVRPDAFEFWQGQTDRLHDRVRFRRPNKGEAIDPSITSIGENGWVYERLAP